VVYPVNQSGSASISLGELEDEDSSFILCPVDDSAPSRERPLLSEWPGLKRYASELDEVDEDDDERNEKGESTCGIWWDVAESDEWDDTDTREWVCGRFSDWLVIGFFSTSEVSYSHQYLLISAEESRPTSCTQSPTLSPSLLSKYPLILSTSSTTSPRLSWPPSTSSINRFIFALSPFTQRSLISVHPARLRQFVRSESTFDRGHPAAVARDSFS